MNILGLDISSHIVGTSVINDKENLLYYKPIFFNKEDDILSKADFFKEKIKEIKVELDRLKISINKIMIEESLNSFRFGYTSNNTIIKLTGINMLCSYITKEVFEINIEFINSRRARNLAWNRKFGRNIKNKKEYILQLVIEKYPELLKDTENFRFKKKRFIDQAYDISDSITVALSGIEKTI